MMAGKKPIDSRKQAAAQSSESDDFIMPVAPPSPPKGVVTGENNQPVNSKAARKSNVGHPQGVPILSSHARLNIDDPNSWSAAAAGGDALAMALLGDALCWGGFAPHGVFRDIPIGLSLLEESSQLGHPLGLFMLSRAQRNIPGYRQPPHIADQTEIKAVSAGFLNHKGEGGAVWWIAEAIAHQEGRIVLFDVNRQLALIQKSLDAGYTDAWTSYAFCLIGGDGLSQNISEGLEWLKRAAKMKNGNAMTYLANCYRNGIGVATDAVTALTWYDQAANAGQDEAFNSLGYCSRNGIGCKKDNNKAFEYYLNAAHLQNLSGIYNVGFCYEKGIGVRADKKLSYFWYAKAISLGHVKAGDGLKRVGRFS